MARKMGNLSQLAEKIKTPPALPSKLDKFPMALTEKEVNDLFSTSIHFVTLLKQKVIILTTLIT